MESSSMPDGVRVRQHGGQTLAVAFGVGVAAFDAEPERARTESAVSSSSVNSLRLSSDFTRAKSSSARRVC